MRLTFALEFVILKVIGKTVSPGIVLVSTKIQNKCATYNNNITWSQHKTNHCKQINFQYVQVQFKILSFY